MVYAPDGFKFAYMNGQSVEKYVAPLAAGLQAVYLVATPAPPAFWRHSRSQYLTDFPPSVHWPTHRFEFIPIANALTSLPLIRNGNLSHGWTGTPAICPLAAQTRPAVSFCTSAACNWRAGLNGDSCVPWSRRRERENPGADRFRDALLQQAGYDHNRCQLLPPRAGV